MDKPKAAASWARASVFPPGEAWANRTVPHSVRMWRLRTSAVAAVVLVWVAGKGLTIRAAPALNAALTAGDMRDPCAARARTMVTSAPSRNNMRSTSRSMGVWNPPVIGALSGPHALAQSCAFRMMSPGQDREQKNAMGWGADKIVLKRRMRCYVVSLFAISAQ